MIKRLIAFMFLLTGCWATGGRGLNLDDVSTKPDIRSQATEITVSDFFSRRMRNRPRKAQVGNWLILYEDKAYVYIGYPRFRGLFDDSRETDELLRTPRPALDSDFPGWQKIDGEAMQDALREALGQTPTDWQAELEKNCIRVTGNFQAEPVNQAQAKAFNLCFDKKTLKLRKQ